MQNNDHSKPNSTSDRKVLSFRAPKIVQKQLAELVAAWGESATHAIHRAIAMAHEREFRKRRE